MKQDDTSQDQGGRFYGASLAFFGYLAGILPLIAIFFSDSEDWEYALPLPIAIPLMTGFYLLAKRKWRVLLGWLMGFVALTTFSIAIIGYVLAHLCVIC